MHLMRCVFVAVATIVAVSRTALAGDAGAPGSYAAGYRTVTVTRTAGGSGTFTALLYYPATAAGENTPFAAAASPCPAVSFGHGFLQNPTQYRSTLAHLATHGYLAIASNSETGLFPSHQGLANDMRSCLTWLEQANTDPGSGLLGAVDTGAFGMSGHSMGGGCSIVAASADARVRALAPLAPAETNVSAIGAMSSLACPVSIIVGTQDSITPTGKHGGPMYQAGDGPKMLLSITGGFHCGFTDTSPFGCDSGSISRAAQQLIVRRLLVEFFNLHLRGDDSRWRAVWGPESSSTPELGRVKDPGATLAAQDPEQPCSAPAGSTCSKPLNVQNTREQPDSFALAAEGGEWAAAFNPAATGTLPPGGTAGATMTITIPPGPPGEETKVISARSSTGARAWTMVTVRRVPPSSCPGDANGDGAVTYADVTTVLAQWGSSGPLGDADGDGTVSFGDITAVLANFGAVCG